MLFAWGLIIASIKVREMDQAKNSKVFALLAYSPIIQHAPIRDAQDSLLLPHTILSNLIPEVWGSTIRHVKK